MNKSKSGIKNQYEKNISDVNLLNKLKPRQVNIDKERLYEENLELKIKSNGLQDEVLKLKTKLSQVEKELYKKDENIDEKNFYSIKPPNLISNLKNTVKELKYQLQCKDDEIDKFNKNLRSSKIIELESEIQAYIDECTRLRHHLEESYKQNGAQIGSNFESEKSPKNILQTEGFIKENKEGIKNIAFYKEEIERLKQKILESKQANKKNTIKKGEVNAMKAEIQKLKEQNEQLSQSAKDWNSKEN